MYWLENIDKYIEHYASPAIVQRGKTLNNIGSVREIDYDTDTNTGVAKVSGGDLYEVSITNGVSQDFRNIATSCTCSYQHGVCKHAVAALLGLKKKFEYDSASVLKMIQFDNQLRNSAREYELTEDLIEKYNIDAQYPSMIRNNETFIVKYDKIGPKLLVFKIGEQESVHGKEKYTYESVSFFLAPGKTTTKCTCNASVIEFCNHQKKALHHLIIELDQKNLLLNFPDLKDLQEQAVESYGLEKVSDIDKFFNLTLGKDGPEYIPKDKEMVSYSDHLYILKKFEDIKSTSAYSIALGEATMSDYLQGVALYIDSENSELPVRLHIIQGKGNASNEKIVSNVSVVDDPSQITPLLRGLFVEYEKIRSLYNNHFSETIHPKLISFLHKHYAALKELPLYAMREKFSFRKSDLTTFQMADQGAEVKVRCRNSGSQFIIEGVYHLDGKDYPIEDFAGELSIVGLVYASKLYIFKDIYDSKMAHLLTERSRFKYSQKATKSFNEHISKLSEIVDIDLPSDIEVTTRTIVPTQRIINLMEKGENLIIQPLVAYDNGRRYIPGDKEEIAHGDGLVQLKRDLELEKNFLDDLSELDNDWKHMGDNRFFHKSLENVINSTWVFDLYSYCKENDIDIEGYDTLSTIRYNPNEAQVDINLTTGIDWFEGEIDLVFGDQKVDLAVLKKAVLKDQKTVLLEDGTEGFLPEEWMEKLTAIFRNSEVSEGKLLISKMKFNLIDELFDEINDEQLRLEIDYRKRRLLDFDSIEQIDSPDTVTATLRPYQKEGLNWLNFLDEFGFGGCLADDMGLGKTLQVITFIAHKKQKDKEAGKPHRPNLVVVPKSLMFNWADELKKFAPSLTYLIYHGNTRKANIRKFHEYDIIISTYGTVTNDIEDIMEIAFSYAILDESHAIKNPSSKRYKAMRLVKADNKIVMTGTPIENQTFDLFAQFNFVNPGFFGSANNFKINYAEPIDVYGNEAASHELRKLVKPFLLRRTKEQVAKDLPPKTESVIHFDMLPKQRAIYDAYLAKYKNYVTQKISENGVQKSKMFVIEALLKLRQICNSPALLNEEETYPNVSAKIEILMDRLSEVIGRHKVLVISQFTSMLRLIEDRIKQAQIPYSYLDGGTRNRKEIVDNFNSHEDQRVFLLSLKAGGVGLNLASAEYVFIVDPWWNPAAEAQAIDRAHRIGQENHVFAYRMICNNSIEEKIQQLQQKKSKMASDIIQVEESFIKSLDQTDIMALFS